MSNGNALMSTTYGQKQEMQGLNDKLAKLMQMMRALKQQGVQIDPEKYRAMYCQLEDELERLKRAYEQELDRLRRKLDEANKDRNKLASDLDRSNAAVKDLQDKLAQECAQNRKQRDDIKNLQAALADREKELADLRRACKEQQDALSQIHPRCKQLAQENEDLKRQLQDECQRRQAAEEAAKSMGDKGNFENQRADQRCRDLEQRLKKADDLIKEQEKKLKQLQNQGADDLPKLLARAREETMADMRKHQKETADALNRQLQALKDQLEKDRQEKDRLKRENEQLKEANRQLECKLHDLMGKCHALKEENDALKRALDSDKGAQAQHIKALQDKVQDLEAQLMDRVKDFNKARDAQADLKAEILMYRKLLEGEEGKYGSRSAGTPMRSRPGTGAVTGHSLPNISNAGQMAATGPNRPANQYCTTYRVDYTPKQRSRNRNVLKA